MRSPLRIAVLVVVLCLLGVAGEASACPMCKSALASHDPSKGDWVTGFFWSICFMVSMPFVLFGGLSTYMYLLVRRARRDGVYGVPAGQPFARPPVGGQAFASSPNVQEAVSAGR